MPGPENRHNQLHARQAHRETAMPLPISISTELAEMERSWKRRDTMERGLGLRQDQTSTADPGHVYRRDATAEHVGEFTPDTEGASR